MLSPGLVVDVAVVSGSRSSVGAKSRTMGSIGGSGGLARAAVTTYPTISPIKAEPNIANSRPARFTVVRLAPPRQGEMR